jgi:hypothetical protein
MVALAATAACGAETAGGQHGPSSADCPAPISSGATPLFALLNAPEPLPAKPRICTEELGPRPLVAISFVGGGKPLGLAAPRQATQALITSLARG